MHRTAKLYEKTWREPSSIARVALVLRLVFCKLAGVRIHLNLEFSAALGGVAIPISVVGLELADIRTAKVVAARHKIAAKATVFMQGSCCRSDPAIK